MHISVIVTDKQSKSIKIKLGRTFKFRSPTINAAIKRGKHGRAGAAPSGGRRYQARPEPAICRIPIKQREVPPDAGQGALLHRCHSNSHSVTKGLASTAHKCWTGGDCGLLQMLDSNYSYTVDFFSHGQWFSWHLTVWCHMPVVLLYVSESLLIIMVFLPFSSGSPAF